MECEHYFYNCSKDYISSLSEGLFDEIVEVISLLPKRKTESEINNDIFWLLTVKGWSHDTLSGVTPSAPADLKVKGDCSDIEKAVNRQLCLTTSTLNAAWSTDFAKKYDDRLVQLEAQFGKVESMFKDFCGFRIARFERRLELGIEIVMSDPNKYFAHRENTVSEMASFEIAKKTLPAINLDCPIWLVGIKE